MSRIINAQQAHPGDGKSAAPDASRWAAMNKVRATILATLAIMASGACIADEEHPEKVIADLYETHQPWRDKQLDYGSANDLSRFFTPELVALFVREDKCRKDTEEICNLDWDPFYCAQDYRDSVGGFRFERKPGLPVRFAVTFTNINKVTVLVVLSKTKQGWRIADVQCPESGSVKEVLEQPLPQ